MLRFPSPLFLTALLLLCRPAFAEAGAAGKTSGEAAAEDAAVAATPAPFGPVLLVLRGDALDAAALRARLAGELNRAVLLEGEAAPDAPSGIVSVTYRRQAQELSVSWDSGDRTVTRVIAAPGEPEALLGETTLLAGNLASQQIDDLLPKEAPPLVTTVAPPLDKPPAPPPEVRLFTLGVFYPLATNYGHPEVTSNFDLSLLYGRVGAIDGAQFGGVNVVQRAGEHPASMDGLQVGYLANVVRGSVHGIQLGGLFDYAGGDADGAQLAFAGTFAGGSVRGLQASTLFNRAGNVSGLQLALINIAGDVHGVQLGLINVARNVRGASVGLINIADDIDGLPLAPFSVTENGGVHPVIWAGSGGFGNAGVKFATRRTYSLLYGSYHRAFDQELVGGGFALGGSVELGAGFRADMDAAGTYLIAPALTREVVPNPERTRTYHEQLVQPRLRLLLAYRATPHLGAFVGVAALGQIRAELGWDRITASVGPEIFGGLEL